MSIRSTIQKELLKREVFPKWLGEFMSDKKCKVIFGNYKIIYIFDDTTISVQKKGSNPSGIYFDLCSVSEEYQPYLNYPKQLYSVQVDGFLYRLGSLKTCKGGDLFKVMFEQPNYSLTKRHFEELGRCLIALHEKGLFVCDLKPENIMLDDDKLVFIDLDMSANKDKFLKNKLTHRISQTMWWDPLAYWIKTGKRYTVTKERCMYNDWFAFSLIYIHHVCLLNNDQEQLNILSAGHKDSAYYSFGLRSQYKSDKMYVAAWELYHTKTVYNMYKAMDFSNQFQKRYGTMDLVKGFLNRFRII